MTRATAALIGLVSIAALLLLTVYFLAQVGFCAGATSGELKGCLGAAAVNSARSPVHLAGWPLAVLGLFVAARTTPRRRGR